MPVNALLILRVGAPRSSGAPQRERSYARFDAAGSLIVGRSRSSDIVLDDAEVSAKHLQLRCQNGRVIAKDLGSSNGTTLIRSSPREATPLPPDEDVTLDNDDALQLGETQLIPCEMLSDSVALTSHTMPGPATLLTMDFESEPAPPRSSGQATQTFLQMSRGLSDAGVDGLGPAVLEAVCDLAGAARGFLVSFIHDRPVLRASRGSGMLSERFLRETAERDQAWSLQIGNLDTSGIASASLAQLPDGTTLVGASFRMADCPAIAVACLQLESAPTAAVLDELTLFAELAAPLLSMAFALDREQRKRQALERSAGSNVGCADSAAAPRSRIIGESPALLRTVDTVIQAANAKSTLLIRGPSGSGKELLARLAHDAGPRREQPYLALNCSALPETLVESELFGVDKGAFTGADRARPGAFAQADGGTLFLDEIGDLPIAAQAKVLRVVEYGELVRVGGSRQRVDVRLVAATNRDLERMVQSGEFREDLYYRLRVVEVTLPTLAHRAEDILPLARHFLTTFRRADGTPISGISTRAAVRLQHYGWPGNIRELRNVIERAVVLDRDGIMDVDDLPAEIGASGPPEEATGRASADTSSLLEKPWAEARAQFEELYFRTALERHAGLVQRTAEAVGVDRRTLSTKISRFGLRSQDDPT